MEEKHNHTENNRSLKEIQAVYGNIFNDLNMSCRNSEFHEILLAIQDIFLSLNKQIQKIHRKKVKKSIIIVLVIMFCMSSFLLFGQVFYRWTANISKLLSMSNLVVELATETLIPDLNTPTLLPSIQTTIYATLKPLLTITPSPTQTISIEGCVNVSQLRVRKEPGKNSALLGGILYGDCYEFFLKSEQSDGTWLGFKFANSTGWVKADYIDCEGDLESLQEFGD